MSMRPKVLCSDCLEPTDIDDLVTDGWGQCWDQCRTCQLHEARLQCWRPCPTCQLRHGFHDRELHLDRVSIPADKLLPNGWIHGRWLPR